MERAAKSRRLNPQPQDLVQAARAGSLAQVQSLLAEGVNTTSQNNRALIEAAKHGHVEVVDCLLVVPGVDPTARNNEALLKAAGSGHYDVVHRLLSVPHVRYNKIGSAVYAAVEKGRWNVVDLLLAESAVLEDPVWPNLAVKEAVMQGQAEVVARLLTHRTADFSAAFLMLFMEKRHRPDLPTVKAFLATPRLQTRQAVKLAIHRKMWDLVEIFLTHRPTVVDMCLDFDALQSPIQRYLKAIKLCCCRRFCLDGHAYDKMELGARVDYRSDIDHDDNDIFDPDSDDYVDHGLDISDANRLVYMVDACLPVGVSELVCESVMQTQGMAHYALHVQREFHKLLNELRRVKRSVKKNKKRRK
eukprot:TRINITY_DN1335_c0_g2_i1.p1 TRINITY_DN1335_c0_g2~~TRINITY_DN1335_c0_g2_i1.p1  ORF type:complete len:417 (+),score=39.92 TRINITY_DN1335_c0_g2_i1:175-1251(+)